MVLLLAAPSGSRVQNMFLLGLCICCSLSAALTATTIAQFVANGVVFEDVQLFDHDCITDSTNSSNCIRNSTAGQGLIVDRDLQSDHVVVRVPLRMVMAIPNAKQTQLSKAFTALPELAEDTSFWSLAIFLMLESHQPLSPWRAYIDSLPFQTTREMPLRFSMNRRNAL